MIAYYFNRGENLFFKWFGLLIILIFSVALIFKTTYIPNHAIVLLLGVLVLTIIYLPLFLFVNLKSLDNKVSIWIHVGGLLFCFLIYWVVIVWYLIPVLQAQFRIIPFTKPQIISAVILTGVGSLGYIIFNILKHSNSNLKAESIYFTVVIGLNMLLFSLNFPLLVQAPDRFFDPEINHPVYDKGTGSLIFVDEGHNNFHTLNDRLITTGRILRRDGYNVKPYKGELVWDRLNECKILIVVNALNEKNVYDWSNPTLSAFSREEIEIISKWVNGGGSLLLVADHMPMPGAVSELASRFGFELENGHANDTLDLPDYFTRGRGTLVDDIITNGRGPSERVDSILTFGGHAFRIPPQATSFMTFDSLYFQWNPEKAWQLKGISPYSIENYSQGAYRKYGQGRIVILGEAMMITAQLGAGLSMIKMGMNSSAAPYNYQLLLNIVHWLDECPESGT
jgi:hypothetical protein